MALIKAWQKRTDEMPSPLDTSPLHHPILPLAHDYYSKGITFIDTVAGMEEMVELARQLPLNLISIDFEYRFSRAPIALRSNKIKYDIRSVEPLLMSLALSSVQGDEHALFPFVIDLRQRGLNSLVQQVLDLPVPYIAHHAKAELHCLWQLGIRVPDQWWCTCIAERSLYLGLHHKGKSVVFESTAEEIDAKMQQDQSDRIRYSLVATASRYGIKHRFQHAKETHQKSFLDHQADQPFSHDQIEYAAEDAIVAAKLYLPQINQTTQNGLMGHLVSIEMPWVVTNARMEWDGVLVDASKRQRVAQACGPRSSALIQQLSSDGLDNPRSHPSQVKFFNRLGLLQHFKKGKGHSFDKSKLKDLSHLHPSISLLAELRKVESVQRDAILRTDIVGIDGRIHPEHKQLEVVTGRQACVHPNLLGLPSQLRPLIVPREGYGVGEADLAQIEIAITAAVYGDAEMIAKYNQGDIYTAMAQDFFANEISKEDRSADSNTFKQSHKDKRDLMKQCTLGIIYGLTAFGLAARLKISEHEAERQMAKFLDMFPTLRRSLQTAPQHGAIRGYVSTSTGLRRYRPGSDRLSRSDKNWMINMPVQGTAAALFKVAGNRLYRLYQAYDARLILAVHDAYVFEAPLDALNEVAELTKQVMAQTVQEYFPQLRPRVDLNISRQECWNKDGDATALERWTDS